MDLQPSGSVSACEVEVLACALLDIYYTSNKQEKIKARCYLPFACCVTNTEMSLLSTPTG